MLGQAPGSTCGGPMMEQSAPNRLHHVERSCSGEVHRELSPTGEPSCQGGQEFKQEEGTAETRCDELATTPIPHPAAPLQGRRWRMWE